MSVKKWLKSEIKNFNPKNYSDKWILKWDECEFYAYNPNNRRSRWELTETDPKFFVSICFKATVYNGTVDGKTFKAGENSFSFARATEIMNSKSNNEFRWSVRTTGRVFNFYIGIATHLERTNGFIGHYDKYAITYSPYDGRICKGGAILQNCFAKVKSGDEMHLRFQPKLKKFSVSVVLILLFIPNRSWPRILERQRIYYRYRRRPRLFSGSTRISSRPICYPVQISKRLKSLCTKVESYLE